jgi:hypothetical protein
MRSFRNKLKSAVPALSLAAAWWAGNVSLANSSLADLEALRNIDRSRAAIAQGDEATATSALSSVASGSASAGLKAHAHGVLGQIELDKAFDAVVRLEARHADLRRVMWEIEQLALQVEAGGALLASYQLHDPRNAREAIARLVAEAQGADGKTAWSPEGSIQLPTLGAARQEIARLEGEIARKQEEANLLAGQRLALIEQADKLAQQSADTRGSESVELFKQASELRKQASNLATDREQVEQAMVPLKKDLEVAQGQMNAVNAMIEQLQQQSRTLEEGWQQIQRQIADQTELSRAILDGGAGGSQAPAPSSILAKAALLKQGLEETRQTRDEAVTALQQAAESFVAAGRSAEDLVRQLQARVNEAQNRPEAEAWRAHMDAVNPGLFKLQEASARRLLGSVHLSDVVSIRARMHLQNASQAALSKSGVSAPPELQPGTLDGELKQASEDARKAFEGADELLQSVIDGRGYGESAPKAARVARSLLLYSRASLARINGDEAAAGKLLEEARMEAAAARDGGAVLPRLPAEITPPPPAAPTAPETPADAPADDQPAAGDAPSGDSPTTDVPVEPPAQDPGASEPPAGDPPATEPPASDPPPSEPPSSEPGQPAEPPTPG